MPVMLMTCSGELNSQLRYIDLQMKSTISQLSVVLQSQLYVFIRVIIQQTLIMLMKMHQF